MRGKSLPYSSLLEACNASIPNPRIVIIQLLFILVLKLPSLFRLAEKMHVISTWDKRAFDSILDRNSQFSFHKQEHFGETWYNKSMSWIVKHCYHCNSTSLYLLRVFEGFKNQNQKEKLTRGKKLLTQDLLNYTLMRHERETLFSPSARISYASKQPVSLQFYKSFHHKTDCIFYFALVTKKLTGKCLAHP